LRSNAFAQQRNSPHPPPVALLQQDCIRIQLYLLLFTARCRTPALKGFVCTALPHRQTPEHSQQSAFAPSCTACFCRRLTLVSRIVFAARYSCMAKTAKAPSGFYDILR